MSLLSDHLKLIEQIEVAIRLPPISRILLPAANDSLEFKDNFGFVVLEDGSVGPFYTCLDNTLEWLQRAHQQYLGASVTSVARRLDGDDIPLSALALGAFNAISQHVMRCSGFDPSTLPGPVETVAPAHIGMVGFFNPLIERYLARGIRITVIEQQPERVPAGLPIDLHTSPEALKSCDYVLCTASTLINNSLESIIQAVNDPAVINLIGPSASGLPDVLFRFGIHSTGGQVIDRVACLEQALEAGESWGKCGRKYQLTAADYPGVTSLLECMGTR